MVYYITTWVLFAILYHYLSGIWYIPLFEWYVVYTTIWVVFGIYHYLSGMWYIPLFEWYLVYTTIWVVFGIYQYLSGIWYIPLFEWYLVYTNIWVRFGRNHNLSGITVFKIQYLDQLKSCHELCFSGGLVYYLLTYVYLHFEKSANGVLTGWDINILELNKLRCA